MSDDGGDPACWLDAVCDRCGALIDTEQPHRCRAPADLVTPDHCPRALSGDDAG